VKDVRIRTDVSAGRKTCCDHPVCGLWRGESELRNMVKPVHELYCGIIV
jgi:hypothetical protein